MEECNDLPVNVGWAYNKDAQKLWQENQETLAKIEGLFFRDACRRKGRREGGQRWSRRSCLRGCLKPAEPQG